MHVEFKHPLRVPKGWLTTPTHQRTFNESFKPDMTMKEALMYIKEELERFGARSAVVFTDVENINNERLRRKSGSETGVSVQLGLGEQRYEFFCDSWQLLEHNLYAISLLLRNFKNMERWGVGELSKLMRGYLDTAYGGDDDIAHSVIDASDWRSALGLGPTATLDDADAVYRRRAKVVASDPEALMLLNRAIEAARQTLKR